MAEVAASIAGLISLSIQLLEKAESIRTLCSRTKGAPQTLLSLSKRLETLSILLEKLAAYTQQDDPDTALLERCAAQLHQPVLQIERLLRNLSRWSSRLGGLGRVAVASRDNEIRGLLEEVEQAETSITLALLMLVSPRQTQHATQHFAAMYAQLNDIQSSMRSIFASLSEDMQIRMSAAQPLSFTRGERLLETRETFMCDPNLPNDQAQTTCNDVVPAKRTSRRNRHSKKYATPTYRITINLTWITSKVWHMAISQAEAGWDVGIRSWNLRSKGSEIFKYCDRGDLNAVQALLKSGRASAYDYYYDEDPPPFDCGEVTLLSAAAREGHSHICKFLLTETSLDCTGRAVEALNWYSLAYDCNNSVLDPAAMIRLFVDNSDVDTDLDELYANTIECPWWIRFLPENETCVQLIQNSQTTDYEAWPIDWRIEISMLASQNDCTASISPGYLLRWICETTLTEFMAKFKRSDGCTLLHLIIEYLCCVRDNEKSETEDFIVDLILLGADVHAIWRHETPFMNMLRQGTYSRRCCRSHILETLRADIAWWQNILQRSGISFLDFLRSEETASQHICATRRCFGDGEELIIKGWTFDKENAEWDPEVYWTASVPVYQWYPIPGAWEEDNPQVRKICWRPFEEDYSDTGRWVKLRDVLIESEPFTLIQTPVALIENARYTVLMQSQDDHGLIALRANRRRSLPGFRRSSSFYGALRPSCTRQAGEVRWLRLWLPLPRVCPYDGRLRFDCGSRAYHGPFFSKECFQGVSALDCSVQETVDWRQYSFEETLAVA